MVLDGYMLPRSVNEARPSRTQVLCLLQVLVEPMPRNYGPKDQALEALAILQQSFPIGRGHDLLLQEYQSGHSHIGNSQEDTNHLLASAMILARSVDPDRLVQ